MVLGFIPARGGSKGLPRKNLALLCGQPLIHWTIKAAHDSRHVDRVVVSTDDAEIAGAALTRGAEVVVRPDHLSTDDANADDAMAHAIEDMGVEPAIVLRLQPTSPLRTPFDIDQAICMVSAGAQAVVGITEPPLHPYLAVRVFPSHRIERLHGGAMNHPRQQYPDWKMVCGAIYAAQTAYWRQFRGFFGPDTKGMMIPKQRAVDIDDQYDMDVAEMRMVENRLTQFTGCS